MPLSLEASVLLRHKDNFTSAGLLERSAKNFLSFRSPERANCPREIILIPSPLCSLNVRLSRPADVIIPISFPLSISQLFRDHAHLGAFSPIRSNFV